MLHKNHKKLIIEMAQAEKSVTVGATYYHYKKVDQFYRVVGIAILEATDELCVIYQAEYDKRLTFVRPLASWLETVEFNGQTVERFSKKA